LATRLDDDEKAISNVDTLGGAQNATIINESGLWSVVLTSRKENAKRFKKWLTSERAAEQERLASDYRQSGPIYPA